ncbi:N-6 DNA methylase [Streptomyces sp. NBC_01207]|uniref:N-6 DNA methylase n=1 Tax=Streptomyces sp. NBC_01207 TaxID=2903772 RepID=UPI002E0E6011|nr:SAM-dependent methyltransferase [Streptomyces sp. NBC_01207]
MNQLDLFSEDQPGKTPAPTSPASFRPALADLLPPPAPVTIGNQARRPHQAQRSAPPASRPANRRYLPLQRNPHRAAHDIAEAVEAAWHGAHGGSRIEIPAGVVAALALWPLRGPDAPLAAHWWLDLNDEGFLAALRECWARWWIQRPDLIDRATPLHRWLEDERPERTRMKAVRAVARAALTHGMLHLTSAAPDFGGSCDADVLGAVVTVMRSHGAREALAEIHTPPELSELMARMLITDQPLTPGMKFDDPASGTGGLYRAAAQHMRELGLNPHDFGWAMTDIDPVAAAGAAVNAILWDLGPHVLVVCANTLTEGNPYVRASREWRESHERRDRMVEEATFLARVRRMDAILTGAA